MQNKAAGEELTLDLTFRYKLQVKDSATVNISFFGNENLKELDKILLTGPDVRIEMDALHYMYSERDKKGFHSRFSATTLLEKVVTLFKSNDWEMKVYKKAGSEEFDLYKPSKKAIKAIEGLQYEIFSLL